MQDYKIINQSINTQNEMALAKQYHKQNLKENDKTPIMTLIDNKCQIGNAREEQPGFEMHASWGIIKQGLKKAEEKKFYQEKYYDDEYYYNKQGLTRKWLFNPEEKFVSDHLAVEDFFKFMMVKADIQVDEMEDGINIVLNEEENEWDLKEIFLIQQSLPRIQFIRSAEAGLYAYNRASNGILIDVSEFSTSISTIKDDFQTSQKKIKLGGQQIDQELLKYLNIEHP